MILKPSKHDYQTSEDATKAFNWGELFIIRDEGEHYNMVVDRGMIETWYTKIVTLRIMYQPGYFCRLHRGADAWY